MFGESGTGTSRTYRYYKCARAKKGKLCDKKAVRKEWMEEIAIQKALGILENAELVNLLVDKLYALQGEENPRLPRLNEQMADIEKRIENMLSAIEQGIITDSTKDRLSQLEANRNHNLAGKDKKAVPNERTDFVRNRKVQKVRFNHTRRKTTIDRRFYQCDLCV